MKMKYLLTLSGLALVVGVVFFAGCASLSDSAGGAASAPNGSKLWAQNCIRCHNSRPPNTFSDAQWDVVMTHMRIRANLTATEHKAISEFIQSAH